MRIILGAIVAAVVFFVWNFAAWMVLGIHTNGFKPLPDVEVFREELTARELVDAVYTIPGPPDPQATAEQQQQWLEAHRSGPVVHLFYRQRGFEPFAPETLGRGFAIDLAASLIAAFVCWHVGRAGGGFLRRVLSVALLGAFVSISVHLAYWNWMAFPWEFTVGMIVDALIGWLLVGIVLALFTRRYIQQPTPA